jgi:protein-L-isoaspartate(D-aspartate) O-methyltransferase
MQHVEAAIYEGTEGDGDSELACAYREDLLRALFAAGDLRTRRVAEAMRRVPRHLFVPEAPLARAYANQPISIGHGQTISQPTIVARMTEALELDGGERVLEIGAGSGYQTAVLACLAREVWTIEVVPALGRAVAPRLARLGFSNVHVRVGDGKGGWPEEAPFDRIVLTAAPAGLPRALAHQLTEHGVVVAPIGPQTSWQSLVRYRREGARMLAEDLGSVRFVPMMP